MLKTSNAKRIISVLLCVVMAFCLVQLPKTTKAEDSSEVATNINKDGKSYVKVYYTREDKDYSGWNIWVWVDGTKSEGGHAEEFDGVDSKGAYKVIARDSDAGKLGVIVRTDSWQKAYDGDVFVDLSKGDTELDFTDGNCTEVKPTSEYSNVTVNVHYYRFDNNYDDWDVYSWMKTSGAVKFTTDSFGAVATLNYADMTSDDNIGYIVRQGGDTWSGREQSTLSDGNRYINKTCINADGQVDVYVVQGDKLTYFNATDADVAKQPKFTAAKIDTLTNVSFTSTFSVLDDAGNNDLSIETANGEAVAISSTNIAEDGKSGTITTASNLDFSSNTYILKAINPSSGLEVTKEMTLGAIYNSADFANMYTYDGSLGALYTKNSTQFVLWAPTASDVKLVVYGKNGKDLSVSAQQKVDMVKGDKGVWTTTLNGDQNGVYYNYEVTSGGVTNETVDPYAKAVGVNGERGMVVDLDSTDPTGWELQNRPKLDSITDATVYEMHIRDFSIGEDSGITYKGKYKGVWQSGTTIPGTDIKTGIDHLKELGVNTVQIMPTYDYNSVDETKLDTPQFNWGYDPQNYNSLEGSYSSDPYTAELRMTEFKELIMALHNAGIRVTMDVVYNHTALSETSNLNKAVPDYYYRQDATGGFSNGSGCGNELASDRSMVRKYMVDSVAYLASEYKLDGFRFDLMALIDKDTILAIRQELDKIDSNISIVGEGWTGGTSSLDGTMQSLKANAAKNFGQSQIAMFSDDFRDGLRGNVFDNKELGFLAGKAGLEDRVKFGITAATISNSYADAWASQPYQCVNYASCHDNLTLYDRLKTECPDATDEELIAMNKMSAAITYTSQGIPFMLSGEEFARTKENADGTLNENSYNASDAVNAIKWSRKEQYSDLYNYYKGMIALRANHKAFRMSTTSDIANNLKYLDVQDSNVIAYTLNGSAVGDKWNTIAVLFNSNDSEVSVTLPSENWVAVVNGESAGTKALETISGSTVTIPAKSSYVLVDKASYEASLVNDDNNNNNNSNTDKNNNTNTTTKDTDKKSSGNKKVSDKKTGDSNNLVALAMASAVAALGVSVAYVYNRKKQRQN